MLPRGTERIVELEESELFDDGEEVIAKSVGLASAIPIPARRPSATVELVRAEEASTSSDSDDDGILLDSDEELSERWTRDNETYSVPSNSGGNLTALLGAGSSSTSYSPMLSARGVPARDFGGPRHGLYRHRSNVSDRMMRAEGSDERVQMTLGTSMPISIPLMPRPGTGAAGRARGDGPRFVPPHLLTDAGEQPDLVQLLSTSHLTPANPRRDRLTARNAIMRATGFLEPKAGAPEGGPDDDLASLATAPAGFLPRSPWTKRPLV
ncbi:hypothetical protein QBZ16_002650 [Prototheca wickerhamii]|uniref:Uncharacterized protein n=1 Tax=Prototheca wickerhamii TaxID=3111 RepID=A0AAD9ML03_PROWI|nr:hypothetical protein QBZ16_002650 [Prototheca wickerhamii]